MKRILVFSDTHGDIKSCVKAIESVPCDMIIHAGDYVHDAEELKALFPDKKFVNVRGNCDMGFSSASDTEEVEVDGVRIFVTHGHRYRVKYEENYKTLVKEAKDRGCQIAVFGHTHMPYRAVSDGIHVLNPGSAFYISNYAIIEIEDGKIGTCLMN